VAENELYVLRHAQSIGNATGDYDRSDHSDLSDRGRRQAQQLSESLAAVEPDAIAVSPTTRTQETIRPALKATGQRGEIWPELSEGCWHAEHMTERVDTIRDGDPIELTNEQAGSLTVASEAYPPQYPPGGETYAEGLERIRLACDRIERQFDDGCSVLVVGHAHLNARLLELLLNIQPVGRFEFDNVGVTKLESADENVIADRWISVANLDFRSATDSRSFP